MKKKVHLVHMISNLGVGGAEGVLYQLLTHLDKKRFSHTVIYFRHGAYVEKIKALGIQTYHVKGFLFPYDPVFFVRLFMLFRNVKPDCLHTLLWAANFLGRFIACAYGFSHVEVLHNNIDQNGMVRTALDRATVSVKGKLVAVSDGVVQSVTEYTPWLATSALTVIKNGIPLIQKTKKTVSRSAIGLSDNHFVIGSVGRFEPVKNYALLLTAFALLYDSHSKVRLVLVGQGSQEQFLRRRAYDLGIDDRVIFVTGQDAQPYYDLFDCFVLSSYKEGVSMALLEAMSKGVAPVITSTSATHDVIEHEKNGLLLPVGDPQLLANALDRLIQSRAVRRKLANQAKSTVEKHFKVERMVQEYSALYEQVVMSGSGGKEVSN